MWTHRHHIAHIPRPAILDLDHQWGDLSALSYALDLTLVESPCHPTSDAVMLWSATDLAATVNRPHDAHVLSPLDPMDDTLRMFWIGSPLCAKYLLRRQLWTAHWFVESRRALFVKAWRLAHVPSRADWGWSKVHEDLPSTVLDALAKTVTPLEYPALAQSLIELMTMMEHYGPQLAARYGLGYPEAPATAVAHMVSQMLT